MAQQDNTLGAPTEGLGQTVTFANSAGSRTPQTPSRQRGAMRNSSRGGEARLTSQALHIPDQGGDATIRAFAKLGEQIVKPIIERERTAAYVSGMQRAAQGEAIAEIVDEQPWFSKLFGSTSLIDGARAYTANAKAASVAADMEAKMPELRKLSANEFGEYATKAITSQTTGDPTTDMMLSQQISATLPSVMKGQAKAHLRYRQEQMETSIQSSQESTFALLGVVDEESRKPGATRDSSDVLGAAISALDVFEKPAEMQQDLHDKLLGESAMKVVSGGNFAVYSLLKDSGKLAKMEPTAAAGIERAYSKAHTEARLSLPLSFADDLSELQRLSNDATSTPEDIKQRATVLNTKYTTHTGDPAPLIRTEQAATEISQWHANQDRLLAEAARRTAGATTKADKEAAQLAGQGQIALVIKGGGYVKDQTAEDKRGAWVIAAAQSKDPEDLARMRAVQATMDNPDEVYANKFQSAVTLASGQAGSPAALHSLYQEYKLLEKHGTTAAAQVYAGKAGKLMAAYDRISQGTPMGPNEIHAAYTQAIVDSQRPDSNLTQAQLKANSDRYASTTLGKLYNAFPHDGFSLRNPKQLAHDTAPFVRSYLAGSEAADVAFADARASGKIAVLAGWHWQTLEGYGNFSAALGKDGESVASDERNRAFNMAVEDRAAKLGITVKAVGQTVNDGDDPQVYIMGMDKDHNVVHTLLKASDVVHVWAQRTVTSVMQGPALNPDTRGLGESALERALRVKSKQ